MQNLGGQTIGRYHIIEQLGEGGMAVVYKAFDTRLECDVAIKFIRMERLSPEVAERALKRFTREAKEMAGLLHPNIVKVTDFGEFADVPYLVMPFVPGGTLKDRLEKNGQVMSYSHAAKILAPVARALEYAHQKGIIHRDIKPGNILITESGQPLLTDFGVAKILDIEKTTQLTGIGMAVGTPEYMAPEQWMGKVTPQVDIYSLGIVFYELITGRLPYTADTPAAVMLKQATEPLPRPREMVQGLPEKVEQVIYKVLARNESDRYADMGSFAAALENLAEDKSEPESVQSTIGQTIKIKSKAEDSRTSEELVIAEESTESKTVKNRTEGTGFNSPVQRNKKLPLWLIGSVSFVALVIILFAIINNQPSPATTILPTKEVDLANTQTTIKNTASIGMEAVTTIPVAVTTETTTQLTDNSGLGFGSTQLREKDGMKMIYIPGGKFIMGSDNGENDEQPVHTASTGAYWIDQTEVTNGMYSKCVQSGKCKKPKKTSSYSNDSYFDNSDYSNFPVIYVDWENANTYCEWADGKLPSEEEWEKAARGPNGKTYPWGDNMPDSSLLNYGGVKRDTTAVGSYEDGKSMYGVYDLSGNVWEWVGDWYDVYPGGDKTKSPNYGTNYRLMRGGSYRDLYDNVRSANREWSDPSSSFSFVGFRCARTVEEEKKEKSLSAESTSQMNKAGNSTQVYLAEVTPISSSVGWQTVNIGKYSFDSDMDNIKKGDPIKDKNGVVYPYGIFAHAPSKILYSLNRSYQSVEMTIFVGGICNNDGVIFEIKGDGRNLFSSDIFRTETKPQSIQLDISEINNLELITNPGTKKNHDCDWSVWGDPILLGK